MEINEQIEAFEDIDIDIYKKITPIAKELLMTNNHITLSADNKANAMMWSTVMTYCKEMKRLNTPIHMHIITTRHLIAQGRYNNLIDYFPSLSGITLHNMHMLSKGGYRPLVDAERTEVVNHKGVAHHIMVIDTNTIMMNPTTERFKGMLKIIRFLERTFSQPIESFSYIEPTELKLPAMMSSLIMNDKINSKNAFMSRYIQRYDYKDFNRQRHIDMHTVGNVIDKYDEPGLYKNFEELYQNVFQSMIYVTSSKTTTNVINDDSELLKTSQLSDFIEKNHIDKDKVMFVPTHDDTTIILYMKDNLVKRQVFYPDEVVEEQQKENQFKDIIFDGDIDDRERYDFLDMLKRTKDENH